MKPERQDSSFARQFWRQRFREWYGKPAWVIPSVVIGHLCLTIPLANELNIWVDEAYSLHTTGQGVSYAFRQALDFEMQPPLYFVLLALWRGLSGSIFFARVFSMICVCLTILASASVSKRFFPTTHPAWLATVVAFNPLTVYCAVEIRLYALVLLLTAFLLLFFYEAFLSEERRITRCAFYGFVSLMALYTHYFTGFLLVGCGVALLVLRRWRELRDLLVAMVVVGLCFSPLLPVLADQVSGHTGAPAEPRSLVVCLKFGILTTLEYALPPGWSRAHEGVVREGVAVAAALAILLLAVKKPKAFLTCGNIASLCIAGVVALSFASVLNLVAQGLFRFYHTSVLFLPSILVSFAVLTSLRVRGLLPIWIALTLVGDGVVCFQTYGPLAKRGDFSRVADYIGEHEEPGDNILIFTSEAALPFAYYYSGSGSVIPLPYPEDFAIYDPNEFVLHGEEEIWEALDGIDLSRLWLVTDREPDECSYMNVQFNCDILEAFVEEHFTVEMDRSFFRNRARLLARKLQN